MKLWGGRFKKDPNKAVMDFTSSLSFDTRLAAYDIEVSISHAKMLTARGILTKEEGESIVTDLLAISVEVADGTFKPLPEDEDIHTAIERALRGRIGDTAGKLHTARSRNDQAVTDLRLFVKDAAILVMGYISELQEVIIARAAASTDYVFAGMTHMQTGQPISFGHHLMAYFWMFERDWRRFRCCYNHADWSPLGAAAFAGTGWPIDRRMTADDLGFSNVIANSIDAVSDRDFAVLWQAMSSLLIMHMSRLSEEIIIWSNPSFGFIELDDAFATGSSIMPQKKNPDIAELVRGKTGRVFGNLQGTLTMLKGQPLSYNRDMQEDKEALFDTFDTLNSALPVFTAMVKTMKVNPTAMAEAAKKGFSTATDLADYLAAKGQPFRDAHATAGAAVVLCQEKGVTSLADLSLDELHSISSLIEEDIYDHISETGSMKRRTSYGGGAPEAVTIQITEAKAVLQKQKQWFEDL